MNASVSLLSGRRPIPLSRSAVFLFFGTLFCLTVAPAGASNETVVYIECEKEEEVRRGSGVLVSSEGHVLTARHVAPPDFSCRGAIENNTLPLVGMVRATEDNVLPQEFDAALWRFVPSENQTFPYAKYCKFDSQLAEESLTVRAFSRQSTGLPSVTSGVLSSYIPTPDGLVESDVLTGRQKSGGPVFLGDTDAIVGIVAGASLDPATGVPESYGVLVADIVAQVSDVMEQSDACRPGISIIRGTTFQVQAISRVDELYSDSIMGLRFGSTPEEIQASVNLKGTLSWDFLPIAWEFPPNMVVKFSTLDARSVVPDAFRAEKCLSPKDDLILFFEDSKLSRVSFRLYSTDECKQREMWLSYFASSVRAQIEDLQDGRFFHAQGSFSYLMGWSDRSLTIVDVGLHRFTSIALEDWVEFIAKNLCMDASRSASAFLDRPA